MSRCCTVNFKQHALFGPAIEVISAIEDHGGEAFMVGGCVRDFLLGQEVKDVDIATSLRPEEIINIFDKVIPVGIEHGTVIVRQRSLSFEVTTYRMEEDYEDYRHPSQVYFVSSIEQDLSRRDFTMNAMAMTSGGRLIDPFSGEKAISEKQIETVGSPSNRFEEDPLRMMRALRFSSQLGFTVSPSVLEVIKEKSSLLQHLSVERLAAEFEKTVAGPWYRKGLNYLAGTGVFAHLPVFCAHTDAAGRFPLVRLRDWSEMLSFYHQQIPGVPAEDWGRKWKLSNRTKKKAQNISGAVQMYKERGLGNYLLYTLGEADLGSWVNVMRSLGYELETDPVERYRSLPIHSRSELHLDTEELLQLFPERKKGKWIGEYLNALVQSVVEGNCVNEKDELIKWIIELDRQRQG